MSRIENEIEHGKYLAKGGAEAIWNWDSPAGKKRAQRRAELLVKYGEIKSTDKILEIGCGTGLFTGKVLELTGATDITAIDISPELLEIAKLKYPTPEFILGDAMKLEYPDNTFDVVFGSSVLHHLDMEKTCKEIYRVLKPEGRIAFAEPNMINPQIAIQKNVPFIKKWLGDSPDETAINRWKFKKMLAKIGYNNISIFPYDFLHPIVPSFLVNFTNEFSKVIEKIPILKEIAGSVIIIGFKK
ncbi:MAG: class I SAM-dependent methyltransferase [Bacteroidia bacterium]|nr:class I SAM-dependent methyltransferase [Bacteroidia bacterium]